MPAAPAGSEGYDEGLAAALRRRATIEQKLATAIRAGEFDLVYQPVVDLRHKQPVAVEALLRWRLAEHRYRCRRSRWWPPPRSWAASRNSTPACCGGPAGSWPGGGARATT